MKFKRERMNGYMDDKSRRRVVGKDEIHIRKREWIKGWINK